MTVKTTTKWLVTLKDGEKKSTTITVTVSAPTLGETRCKIDAVINDLLKEGWSLHFTSLREVLIE
jgi:hypothetical protein